MTDDERQRVLDWLYPPGTEPPYSQVDAYLAYDDEGNCRVVNALSGASSSVEEVREALEGMAGTQVTGWSGDASSATGSVVAAADDEVWRMEIDATSEGEPSAPTMSMRVSADGENWQTLPVSALVVPLEQPATVYRARSSDLLSHTALELCDGEVAFTYPSFVVAGDIPRAVLSRAPDDMAPMPTLRVHGRRHVFPSHPDPTADEIRALRRISNRDYLEHVRRSGVVVEEDSPYNCRTWQQLADMESELAAAGAMTPAVRRMFDEARELFAAEVRNRFNEQIGELSTALDVMRDACSAAAGSTAGLADAFASADQSFRANTYPDSRRSPAYRRARALLLRHLTPAQSTAYRATGSFLVQGSNGWVYRLNSWRSINVETVGARCLGCQLVGSNGRELRSKRGRVMRKAARRQNGKHTCVLGVAHTYECGHVHLSGGDPLDYSKASPVRRHFCLELPDCPLPDQLLAQKLMIEADEGEFLAQARERGAGATAGRAEYRFRDPLNGVAVMDDPSAPTHPPGEWGWSAIRNGRLEGGIVEEWGDRREALRRWCDMTGMRAP